MPSVIYDDAESPRIGVMPHRLHREQRYRFQKVGY
jgi:hypothetical protein